MTTILLSGIFSFLNAIRGAGYLPRICVMLMMGAASTIATISQGFSFNEAVAVFAIVTVGMYFGFIFGWGKYFAIFTGNMETIKESEVKWIDWLTNKLLGAPQNVTQLKWWSFMAFSLRGTLFYPTFVGLAYFNPSAWLIGVGVIGMGICYGLMNLVPLKYAVRGGEILYGALLGLLVALCI